MKRIQVAIECGVVNEKNRRAFKGLEDCGLLGNLVSVAYIGFISWVESLILLLCEYSVLQGQLSSVALSEQ